LNQPQGIFPPSFFTSFLPPPPGEDELFSPPGFVLSYPAEPPRLHDELILARRMAPPFQVPFFCFDLRLSLSLPTPPFPPIVAMKKAAPLAAAFSTFFLFREISCPFYYLVAEFPLHRSITHLRRKRLNSTSWFWLLFLPPSFAESNNVFRRDSSPFGPSRS